MSTSPNGHSGCYQREEFPDVEGARDDEDAMKVARGPTRIAAHVPAGQILALTADGSTNGTNPQVICVKH